MLCRGRSITVRVLAPAKLNLFLRVLGKRPDGYHELQTLMLSVSLYDTLTLTDDPAGELRLACFDGAPRRTDARRELPGAGRDNLVFRAADLLRQKTGCSRGARIELIKRIPMAAGLAGGSSDAAAALLGLNRVWQLGLSSTELQLLGAELGSDIPFFLGPSPAAICRGRGEIVDPIALPGRLWFVIARPPTGLSTADVYRHCRPSSVNWSAEDVVRRLARGDLVRGAGLFHNALTEPAERLSGDVTRIKTAFAGQPFAGHSMSGSGSAWFGLCRSKSQAFHLAARLKAARLGDVFVASSRP